MLRAHLYAPLDQVTKTSNALLSQQGYRLWGNNAKSMSLDGAAAALFS